MRKNQNLVTKLQIITSTGSRETNMLRLGCLRLSSLFLFLLLLLPIVKAKKGIKLFGCNDGNQTKPTWRNQRWRIEDHSIVFEQTSGCVTAAKEEVGSILNVAPCNPLCASEQGWNFDATQQKISNGDLCLEASSDDRTLTAFRESRLADLSLGRMD